MEREQFKNISKDVLKIYDSLNHITQILCKTPTKPIQIIQEKEIKAGIAWSVRDKSCRDWEESLRRGW